MRRTALALALLAAGCSTDSRVAEGDRHFEARDFDAAVTAYEKAAAKSGGEEVTRKLDAARRNAATARAARAAEAAERGDLELALREIAASRNYDPAEARYTAEEKRYAALKADVAAQLARAKQTDDAEEAWRILSGIARYAPTFAEIEARQAQVGDRYVRKLLAAAEDLGKTGQWLKSQVAVEAAAQISAKNPALSELVKATRTNLRVLELLEQGYRLKAQDDLEGALARFSMAAELRPDASEAVTAARGARRELAAACVAAAREARDGADAVAAFRALARAEALDAEAPGIAEIGAPVRRDAAKALLAMAADAGKRGLAGLEWLRLSQAKAVRPDDPAVERALREATTKLDKASRPLILVKEFRNGTRQAGREVRLASEAYRLLQQMSGNGKLATVLDEDAYQIFLKESPGLTPDLIVKGTLERFDLIHHPDRRQPEFRNYEKRVTYLDLTGQKYVEGVENRTYYYTVTQRSVSGAAELSYEIYDVGSRRAMASDAVKGELHREDRIVAGNREAGVEEDPDELPADETLQDDLQTQIKDRLLERLRGDLGWVGKRYYTAYLDARDAGHADAAVSWAVVAHRSLEAAGKPALAEDNDYVVKRTGWSLREGKLVPEQLK